MIKLLVLDIDGVLTDGKIYYSENGVEQKTLSFKDLDAVTELRARDIKLGIITGEKNFFTQYVNEKIHPDYFEESCKEKKLVLMEIAQKMGVLSSEICYIGDGRYDKEAIAYSGLGVCPADAIAEVKTVADVVLTIGGGQGCIAELLDVIRNYEAGEWMTKRTLNTTIQGHISIARLMKNSVELKKEIEKAIEVIKGVFSQKGQLLLCGNGGSAADAQHIATEFVSRFYRERAALNAEALTVNTSSITAIGNDYSFQHIFARQVEAKGKVGDILIVLSTSGNSQNVILAVRKAKEMGMTTIAFTGADSTCSLVQEVDIILSVPSDITPRIQEMHILIGHIICECVEEELYGNSN